MLARAPALCASNVNCWAEQHSIGACQELHEKSYNCSQACVMPARRQPVPPLDVSIVEYVLTNAVACTLTGGVQAVCKPVFCGRDRGGRQRADHARGHPPLRGGAGPLFRQRLRARPHLQFPQGQSSIQWSGTHSIAQGQCTQCCCNIECDTAYSMTWSSS